MTVHTGKLGMITGGKWIRNWAINEGYTTNAIVHSGSKFGTDRENGPYDWTGSFAAYGHSPIAMPGDILAFEGYKAPDVTDDEDNGEIYSGDVYIESIALTINFQTNEIISHVVNFGGSGDLTISNGLLIEDANAPINYTPCAGKIVTFVSGTPDVETILQHVTTVTLTLSRPSKTSVNSGTTTGAGKCLTERHAGPAVDWVMAIATEEGNRNITVTPGSHHKWRLYVTASEFWELTWGKVKDITGLTVNRDTGEVISQTYNVEMKGFASATTGNITLPGAGSAWWPAA